MERSARTRIPPEKATYAVVPAAAWSSAAIGIEIRVLNVVLEVSRMLLPYSTYAKATAL